MFSKLRSLLCAIHTLEQPRELGLVCCCCKVLSRAGAALSSHLLAEVAGRRREAHDTAARISGFARARRAAVLAARLLGGTRTVHVRRVTLLLAGETAPRHA